MSNWQAPNSHNQGEPTGVSLASARAYLDLVTGRVKWFSGPGALPFGAIPLYVIIRGDGIRVFSDSPVGERSPLLFGSANVLIW